MLHVILFEYYIDNFINKIRTFLHNVQELHINWPLITLLEGRGGSRDHTIAEVKGMGKGGRERGKKREKKSKTGKRNG